jgi:transglutaminase-like putative cysteine protease
VTIESLSDLARECYLRDDLTEHGQAQQAIADYNWVKENILYRCSHWGVPGETLIRKSGNCGAKAELLGELLELHGMQVRYVEGRPLSPILPIAKPAIFSVHFWVEVSIGGKWLTLDPSPDSGIAHFLGDTEPGYHLSNPTYTARWNRLPSWFNKAYNHPLTHPLRWATNIKLGHQRRQQGR